MTRRVGWWLGFLMLAGCAHADPPRRLTVQGRRYERVAQVAIEPEIEEFNTGCNADDNCLYLWRIIPQEPGYVYAPLDPS